LPGKVAPEKKESRKIFNLKKVAEAPKVSKASKIDKTMQIEIQEK
jgi:hypothetical protein